MRKHYKRDLKIGEVFHRLKVIKPYKQEKSGNLLFTCKCECGNTVHVTGINLLSGNTKSCGCLRYKNIPVNIIKDLRKELFDLKPKELSIKYNIPVKRIYDMKASYRDVKPLTHRVSDLDKEEVIKLYNGLESFYKISKITGRSIKTIKSILNENNLLGE